MADKGQALPDGSFPIANEADLKNAIQAYGRASDKAKAKEHIIKRARALGATDLLPDDWDASTAAAVVAAPHTTYTYDESKHRRDENGMFAPKSGGDSSSSGRGRVERRRRESGAAFGERAYARAAEREAEKAAEKAGKRSGGRGLTDEERAKREAEKKAKEAERAAEKAKREAEKKAKEEARRQREIDLANHKYKDKRIPPGFARKMVDAMKQTPQAGISDVKDALSVDPEKVGTLPFSGPEKIAFIDYLKERMPASRLQVEEDGSGWYLDNTGRLYRIPSDDDYVKNG